MRADVVSRPMGDTLKLTPGESVTVRSSTPEALEVEGVYGAGGSPPPPHFHPRQDEHFEVLSGSLLTKIDGSERTLQTGQTVDIPAGTTHQMWNPGEIEARVLWRTAPRGRTEEWFRAIDGLHREGRVGSNGMPGPLAFGAYLSRYRDTFRLAVGPDLLVRPVLELLGLAGRLRGY